MRSDTPQMPPPTGSELDAPISAALLEQLFALNGDDVAPEHWLCQLVKPEIPELPALEAPRPLTWLLKDFLAPLSLVMMTTSVAVGLEYFRTPDLALELTSDEVLQPTLAPTPEPVQPTPLLPPPKTVSAPSRLEPARPEPVKPVATPRPEPTKPVAPPRPEPVKTEPIRQEPVRQEPPVPEPVKPVPARAPRVFVDDQDSGPVRTATVQTASSVQRIARASSTPQYAEKEEPVHEARAVQQGSTGSSRVARASTPGAWEAPERETTQATGSAAPARVARSSAAIAELIARADQKAPPQGMSSAFQISRLTEELLEIWPPTQATSGWVLTTTGETRCVAQPSTGEFVCLTRLNQSFRVRIGNFLTGDPKTAGLEAALKQAKEVMR